MNDYTFTQWLFFFYIYSFVGWIWESSYCSIKGRHPVNRGFLKGPMIPIYGSGACVMLMAAAPFRDNLILTFVSGSIIASILEYATGAAMEAIFKVRYWDYSKQPLNLNGHICLGASLGWGFATILITRVIHGPVDSLMRAIPYTVLNALTFVTTIFFVSDFSISFKDAIDLRNLLVRLDNLKTEADRIHKRMDVILAVVDDERQQSVARIQDRIEYTIERIEDKILLARAKVELSEEQRDEIDRIRLRIGVMKDRIHQLALRRDIVRTITLKGNPNLSSVKYKESLEELKNFILTKRHQDDAEKHN